MVTIKIALLLGAQIRFFFSWTAIGHNHLVMSACLLFWVLSLSVQGAYQVSV